MAVFDRKDDYLYIRWAQEVKRRDFHTCQICSINGVELNSHHLNSWNSHPDERYDIENGVTLCTICHNKFHDVYGRGDNTEDQFNDFVKAINALKKSSIKKRRLINDSKSVAEKIKEKIISSD